MSDAAVQAPMNYSVREVPLEVSPLRLRTKRFSAGALGVPVDVKRGFTDTVWFTGEANAVGCLDASRKLAVFPRAEGTRPHLLSEGYGPTGRIGFWFTDPDGDRIGWIGPDGKYEAEISVPAGSAPRCIGSGTTWEVLAGTAKGSLIFILSSQGQPPVHTPLPTVDAVAWGPDGILWHFSGSNLQNVDPKRGPGRAFQLPAAVQVQEMIADRRELGGSAWYADASRNVIGWVRDWQTIVEYQLPNGVRPRAMVLGARGFPWFTGRDGHSLFQLEYRRRVIEYRCETAGTDLTRLVWAGSEFWFTEPAAKSVSVASVAGF